MACRRGRPRLRRREAAEAADDDEDGLPVVFDEPPLPVDDEGASRPSFDVVRLPYLFFK